MMSRPSPVHAVQTLAAFDPNAWARRFKANADESSRNSMMDSGWSGATADRCSETSRLLLFELFHELREVELKPEDFFDRPKLAAVLAAVIEASK